MIEFALGGAMLALLGVEANSYGLAVILSPYDVYLRWSSIHNLYSSRTCKFVFTFIIAYLCCTKGTIDGRR